MSLELLHEELRVYARQHADIQALRKATGNRIGALERSGLGGSDELDAQMEMLTALEHQLDLKLARLVKQHPLHGWVQQAKGISPRTFALLFGITDDLNRFDNVAKLWAYLGLHVVNGESPRRKKGQKANWNNDGRTRCFLIGEAIVKVGAGGKYREAYDRKKAEYLARERLGESGCPMGQEHKNKNGGVIQCVKKAEDGTETSAHLHAAAMRYAVKELLKDMWVEWHRVVPVEMAA